MRIATAVALPPLALLPACALFSYEQSSPDAIAKDVVAAMSEVRSVRMEGTVTEQGETVRFALSVAANGACRGTYAIKGEGTTRVLVTRKGLFIKPDERAWRARVGSRADAVIDAVDDRWIATPASRREVAEMCAWSGFRKAFDDEQESGFGSLEPEHDITDVIGRGDLHGQETVRVEFEYHEGVMGEAHVLADEPHYLVGIQVEGTEFVTFSEFNKPVNPGRVPKDVVDIDEVF